MQLLFENQSAETINQAIRNCSEDLLVILKGKITGTLLLENRSNITIKGENARLCGTKTISNLTPKKEKDNVYSVPIHENIPIERIWIDSTEFHMARYPNCNDAHRQKYCTLTEARNRLNNSLNPTGAYLRGLHDLEWGGNAYKIYKAANGKTEEKWIGNNNRGSGLHKSKVILENLFEELDAAFEFYHNPSEGILYFYSETPLSKSITVEYSVYQSLIEIKNCCNVKITDLIFEKTDNSMFKGNWHRYLRSDWAYNDSACVNIQDSSNVSFENCEFSNLGNTAVLIRSNSQNVKVENCNFCNSFSNGILILGEKESTYCTSSWENDNHICDMEAPNQKGAKNNNYPKNIVIDNCLFKWIGLNDLQSAGVCISLAYKVKILNSSFCHLPRAGINISENAFGGHEILKNDLWDCVRETGDHGLFNSWGRDRFWSLKKFDTTGKYGKIKKPYAFYDMLGRNKIIGNRFVGNGSFGIDLDDGSSGYDIRENICIGVSIKLREGFERVVDNNVIINAPFDYHCAFWGNDDLICNNIVCNFVSIKSVLSNKGSNALFQNNYHISDKGTKKQQFIKTADYSVKDIYNGNYSFPKIKTISCKDFRKNNTETPEINFLNETNSYIKQVHKLYTVTTVDNSIRTACGAPDYNGIFFEKLFPLSRYFITYGLRKGDLIIEIDGKIPDINSFVFEMRNAKKIILIRKQQKLCKKLR